MSFAKRKATLAALEKSLGHTVCEGQSQRSAQETTISGGLIRTSSTPLPALEKPLQYISPHAPPDNEESKGVETGSRPKKTQRAELLEEFEPLFPSLLDLLLDREAESSILSSCDCNRQGQCFIRAHHQAPTHWAEVWNIEHGYFTRRDISTLRESGYAFHLCHNGKPCPSPDSETDLDFDIIDTNGIHNTKIRFCHCPGAGDRISQLMKHRLFPSTARRPKSAFSFQLLTHFHRLHLESKVSKYDFMGSLRRITDNAFSRETSNFYPQFRVVSQLWVFLTTTKRLGQAHGIDERLPHRPPGNLSLYCPACPEPSVNTGAGSEDIPPDFCHLNQLQDTLDGNFHLNKFAKNTDPEDLSLFKGKAYIPEDRKFSAYLAGIAPGGPEKCTCENLQAINKQSRRRFKNMDKSGVVCCQCSHVVIKSSVDLHLGERFAHTDYALAHAIRQCSEFNSSSDHLVSYDISCGYSINALRRFEENFPELVDVISRIRWLIPLVHVQNHKDNCTYLFSSAYTPNAGHFHGETAEHFWPEGNQIGAQTRQMNNGHRHDTMIDHYGDWNWKKIANMGATLYHDVNHAKALFELKRDSFQGLCDLYADKIQSWNQLNRSVRTLGENKEISCVYRHSQKKVPSQSRVFEILKGGDADPVIHSDDWNNEPGPSTRKKLVASVVNEGMLIRAIQQKIRSKSAYYRKYRNNDTKTEIDSLQESLRSRIDKWRAFQKRMMPHVGDHVAEQIKSGRTIDNPENELLFLPSDFPEATRLSYFLTDFAECERQLSEGLAYDLLQQIRVIVKIKSSLKDDKKAQDFGQARNTRSRTKILDVQNELEEAIEHYNTTRKTLVVLGAIDEKDQVLAPLSLSDTHRKKTNAKRAVGDTYRPDGRIWNSGITAGAPSAPKISATASTGFSLIPSFMDEIGTQGSKRKNRQDIGGRQGPQKKQRSATRLEDAITAGVGSSSKGGIRHSGQNLNSKTKQFEDGWIWKSQSGSRLNETELDAWVEEGDRIQWFRAEAEMQRWQEEWERKQAEFLRCIRSFQKMSEVWMGLAGDNQGGPAAYARKKAAMYQEMSNHAQNLLVVAGYGVLLQDNYSLVDHLQKVRLLPENDVYARLSTALPNDPAVGESDDEGWATMDEDDGEND